MNSLPEIPETHLRGHISLENVDLVQHFNLDNTDFGIQIAKDGRVWICANTIAVIRFKPNRETTEFLRSKRELNNCIWTLRANVNNDRSEKDDRRVLMILQAAINAVNTIDSEI